MAQKTSARACSHLKVCQQEAAAIGAVVLLRQRQLSDRERLCREAAGAQARTTRHALRVGQCEPLPLHREIRPQPSADLSCTTTRQTRRLMLRRSMETHPDCDRRSSNPGAGRTGPYKAAQRAAAQQQTPERRDQHDLQQQVCQHQCPCQRPSLPARKVQQPGSPPESLARQPPACWQARHRCR